MTAVEYILDGLEAELALERELGVRVVECDRNLLRPPQIVATRGKTENARHPPSPPSTPHCLPSSGSIAASVNTSAQSGQSGRTVGVEAPVAKRVEVAKDGAVYDLVFLHHAPLNAAGQEMMENTIRALGYKLEDVPIVAEGKVPRAKVYVVLGGKAREKWMPGKFVAPGSWTDWKEKKVYVTYSPVYILRFKTVTDEVKRIKVQMWSGLKSIVKNLKEGL